MRSIVKDLCIYYKMKDVDWLGYKLSRHDKFTFHHIVPRSKGGSSESSNCAVLCGSSSHQYIHIIEYKNPDTFKYLSLILKEINNQGYMPTKQQLLTIDWLLSQFEEEHKDDQNKKGKYLIRSDYSDRIQKNPVEFDKYLRRYK